MTLKLILWKLIVGTKKALSMAVRNVTVNKRNTMLAERLRRE